ncbi:hypothetical protein JCM10213v2_002605 [Rhodosporidiobolus nylandii]
MPAAANKEKGVSLKGDQAEELVLTYLKEQNRPYGATDLSANLKNRVSKPQAQKALASLADKGEILAKTWGKTTVYCALQDGEDELSPEDLAELEEKIEALKTEEQKLKEDARVMSTRKMDAGKTFKTVHIAGAAQTMEAKAAALAATLATRKSAAASSASNPSATLSASALTALSAQYTSLLALATQRRKLVLDIEGLLLEGLEKKKGRDEEEVWELVGGEWAGEQEKEMWEMVKEVEKCEKEMKRKGGKK